MAKIEKTEKKRYVVAGTNVQELLDKYPFAAEVLNKYGIHCVGCHGAKFDTIYHGAHEFKVDVEKLLDDLNDRIEKEIKKRFVPSKEPAKKAPPIPPQGMDAFALQQKRIEENLARIHHTIAVYSGKGGVGKTTVATNLAAYLASTGKTVCLLDADIDCPNVNKILGVSENIQVDEKRKRIIPIQKHGIKILSMASLQESEDVAIAWRGPMIAGAIRQFLEMTDWGNADYLIIDLPPGTSDAPMTLMQSMTLTGVVIVTQPQEVAVVDARKSANLAKKLGVRILGVVENMSGDVFGTGGGKRAAEGIGAPFLGTIPLVKNVREASEKGVPAVTKDTTIKQAFKKVVEEMRLPDRN